MSSSARKSSASKIKLDTYDDLFGNDTAENSSLEQIISVPLADLHTFKDHPFRVVDDEKMEETTERGLSSKVCKFFFTPLSAA